MGHRGRATGTDTAASASPPRPTRWRSDFATRTARPTAPGRSRWRRRGGPARATRSGCGSTSCRARTRCRWRPAAGAWSDWARTATMRRSRSSSRIRVGRSGAGGGTFVLDPGEFRAIPSVDPTDGSMSLEVSVADTDTSSDEAAARPSPGRSCARFGSSGSACSVSCSDSSGGSRAGTAGASCSPPIRAPSSAGNLKVVSRPDGRARPRPRVRPADPASSRASPSGGACRDRSACRGSSPAPTSSSSTTSSR